MSDVLGLEQPEDLLLPCSHPREDLRDSSKIDSDNEETFEDIVLTPNPDALKVHATEIVGTSSKKVEESEKKLSQRSPDRLIRVYVDMVGDLFHAGHVGFLKTVRNAIGKEFGSENIWMIVGITNDAEVIPYKRKPITTMDERVESIEACRFVNEVIPNTPMETTQEFIKDHNIDIVAHGDDFNTEKLKKYYKDPVEMGIFRTVPYGHGVSTTDLIRRCAEYFNSSNFAESDHEDVSADEGSETPSYHERPSGNIQLSGQA